MDLKRFSDFVLKLTASTADATVTAYQEHMIYTLADLIDFDMAWWGWSSFTHERISLLNSGHYGLLSHFETDVRALIETDPFVQHGRKLKAYVMLLDPENDWVRSDYREFLKKYNIGAMMNGHCQLDESSDYNFFMSIYRKPGKSQFTTDDAETFRQVLYHLEQNLSLVLRGELTQWAGPLRAAALFDKEARIVRATRKFQSTLDREDLPTRKRSALLRKLSAEGGEWRGKTLILSCDDYSKGLRIIRAAEISPWELLSQQERVVAQYLREGKTAGEISEIIGVSQNTVRNQIASIYRKLDVNSKVQLLGKLELQ